MRFIFLLYCIFIVSSIFGQDNYEIQVYGSETIEPHRTMVELHSNYTVNGSTNNLDGTVPSNHIFHETIEITHGFTNWFETGFYFFNAIGNNKSTGYVGSHIRPRVSAPLSWHWPVGVSISAEIGFQKKVYTANTSTLELRGIVDKKWNRFYLAVNPVFDKSFVGPDAGKGFIFSPNLKSSFDINKIFALGLEYYGSTGPLFHFDSFNKQQHQLFVVTDLNFDPKWEINAGIGYGFTKSTDREIIKLILGRKF